MEHLNHNLNFIPIATSDTIHLVKYYFANYIFVFFQNRIYDEKFSVKHKKKV